MIAMKLTKYEHACFTLEKNGHVIVLDPGSDSFSFTATSNIVAVLVTHEHADHCSVEQLQRIASAAPNASVYGPSSVCSIWRKTTPLNSNDAFEVGGFTVQPYIMKHDLVHPESTAVDNIGYLIDDTVFYGGDSIQTRQVNASVLLVPIAANWMRLADVIDYTRALQPAIAIPTHDRLLSATGKKIADAHMLHFTKDHEVQYKRLETGTSLTVGEEER